jgi:hypothetical protein
LSGLAETLREAEPGTKVRLVLKDGQEVAGTFSGINGESVSLDDGQRRIELKQVKRLYLDFGSSKRKAAAA